MCGACGRKMESAWSHGKAAYRCRHGHTTATAPDAGQVRNAYVREDRILAQLPALHLLLAGRQPARRRRTRHGADTRPAASPEDILAYLREQGVTLTWDQASRALRAKAAGAATSITVKAS